MVLAWSGCSCGCWWWWVKERKKLDGDVSAERPAEDENVGDFEMVQDGEGAVSVGGHAVVGAEAGGRRVGWGVGGGAVAGEVE